MPQPEPQPLTPEFLRQRLADSITPWRETLEAHSLERLNQPDPNGGWTLGQVFTHCYFSASRLFIPCAETCITAGVVESPGSKNENGEKIYAYQSFPPIEIKMPESVSFVPPEPDSIARLEEQLDKIEARAKVVIDALEDQPDLNATSTHFAFGELNAAEWVLMTSMHYDHHRRQRDRLSAGL